LKKAEKPPRHPGNRISDYPGPMFFKFSRFQMALLHESKIIRYDPRHSGNYAAIIRNLAFYYHWIPDIFPEIQEKFRDDGDTIHSCNKAIPDIFV